MKEKKRLGACGGIRRKTPPRRRRGWNTSQRQPSLRLPADSEAALCKLRCARDWLDAAESLISTSPEQRYLWRLAEFGTDPELLRASEVLGDWGAPDAIETALDCLIIMAAEARASWTRRTESSKSRSNSGPPPRPGIRLRRSSSSQGE